MTTRSELHAALAGDAQHRRRRTVSGAVAAAREATARPPTERATERDLDAYLDEDLVRRTPWYTSEPADYERAFAADDGKVVTSTRWCRAFNRETGRHELVTAPLMRAAS